MFYQTKQKRVRKTNVLNNILLKLFRVFCLVPFDLSLKENKEKLANDFLKFYNSTY